MLQDLRGSEVAVKEVANFVGMRETSVPDSDVASTGCFQRQSQVHVDLRQRGITTLGDFVDEESIGEVSSRAEISFEQLKVSGIFAKRALRSSSPEQSRSSRISSNRLSSRSAS